MNGVKVSIIIPVYNPGDLLKNCLDSVLNQTLNEIEILCIDDGSTDDSLMLLREYADNDKRFRIFTQENSGAASARNIGIQHAKGEYIIFLDSDDWIEKDMCEVLYNNAEKLNTDLVLFNAIWHLKDNVDKELIHFDNFKEDYETFTFDYHYIKHEVMSGFFGVIWCKFYKTSFINENEIYFTNRKMYNDVEFHVKTLLLANKIAYYPKFLYHYMVMGQPSLQSSFTGTRDSMCFNDVMVGVKEFLMNHNLMDEFKIEFLNYTFNHFKIKLNQMDSKYKTEYFSKIKSFLESLTVLPIDFEKIGNFHIPFYIHVINSKDYDEFKLIHNKFNGEKIRVQNKFEGFYADFDVNDEIEPKFTSNKVYMEILENDVITKFNELNNTSDELNKIKKSVDELQKNIELLESDKTNLNEKINTLESDKINLNEKIDSLEDNNTELISENNELKRELDEIKSSNWWKLKTKINI